MARFGAAGRGLGGAGGGSPTPLGGLVSTWLQEERGWRGAGQLWPLYQHSLGKLLLLLAGTAPTPPSPPAPATPPTHVPSLSLQRSPQAGGGSCFTEVPWGLGRAGGGWGSSSPHLPCFHVGTSWVPSRCPRSRSQTS